MLVSDRKITPNLWFDDQAEKAEGSVMTVAFTLEGRSLTALNGGPQFPFTEAVSFIVHCGTQEEVDRYWERLSEGADATSAATAGPEGGG